MKTPYIQPSLESDPFVTESMICQSVHLSQGEGTGSLTPESKDEDLESEPDDLW